MSPYIKKMSDLGLLKKRGFALDLGCGNGDDSEALKSLGYEVVSIDIDSEYAGIKSDIRDFKIEQGKYAVIICNNILPFIPDKEDVKRIIQDICKGLNLDGVAFFTLFGVNDEWSHKPSMSFFGLSEISSYIKDLGIFVLEYSMTEGYGKTIKGDIKYWHIHRFLCAKKPLKM